MRSDAEFFGASVLLDIERNLRDGKRRKTARSAYLQIDNAPAHTPNGRGKKLPEPKSPGSCIRLIFLMFGHLKGEMAGFIASSAAAILSEIGPILQNISKDKFVTMCDEWIKRIEWITVHKGDYYHTEEKKSGTL
jgi:hypothetical protein